MLLAVQWVVLPAIPAAWLVYGLLLCLATAVTKNIVQPPLYSHRPIPVFSCEFLRWWLVQRMISVTNLMFADQLRGTAYLAWWFRALVGPRSFYTTLLSWGLLPLLCRVQLHCWPSLGACLTVFNHLHCLMGLWRGLLLGKNWCH